MDAEYPRGWSELLDFGGPISLPESKHTVGPAKGGFSTALEYLGARSVRSTRIRTVPRAAP